MSLAQELPGGGPSIETIAVAQPKLFQPIRIRGLHLPNRIVVSPMGMYSAPDGEFGDFQLMHYGHFALRGAALTMVEVTAVLANGRSSPLDAGLWKDSQIAGMKRVVDFVHAQEGDRKIGIQLGHAGRKGGMLPIYPGQSTRAATKEEGGWEDEVWGASAIRYLPNYILPKEMEQADMDALVEGFADSADRAVQAGFDAIEVHGAHGYLLSSFLSPSYNNRTDAYGGSFQNRIRIVVDVVKAIRSRIPDTVPLFVRISATDWMEHSPKTPQWTIQDSIDLSLILSDLGVDLIDVSSAANNPLQQIPLDDAYYQINLAEQISKALRKENRSLLVAAVGKIDNAAMAEGILEDGKADVVFVARQFLLDPSVSLTWAGELGLEKQWPRQYVRLGNKPMGIV